MIKIPRHLLYDLETVPPEELEAAAEFYDTLGLRPDGSDGLDGVRVDYESMDAE